jgi:hypothetical protein
VTITEQARQLRAGGQAVDFRGASLVVLEKMGLRSSSSTNAVRKSVDCPPKSSAASWRSSGATSPASCTKPCATTSITASVSGPRR